MRRDPCRRCGPLNPIAFVICALLACGPALADPLSAFRWSDESAVLGGLSGVEIAADGDSLLALSDRGFLIVAQVTRGAGGAITGLTISSTATLRDADGQRAETRGARDSEGLAVTADGQIFVAYEGDHRVVAHAPDGAELRRLAHNPAFADLEDNGSLEGLAVDGAGTLYTLAERGADGPAPIYRLDAAGWNGRLTLTRRDGFEPVGMETDDTGRLYLLERRFRALGGFASRIRRFEIAGDTLLAETTVLETPHGRHSNLEGLSLWRDAAGRLIATMVSDDNFSVFLRTEVVEYVLPE